ncbi:hypothetical protein ACSAZK_07160 [Methanosarcina sp. Mfa9]|uniref:hypothetical protein n=1 Tax=Methanosarcina sp. Mfa9 TaxID=3439063 RepID=UPI003F85479E
MRAETRLFFLMFMVLSGYLFFWQVSDYSPEMELPDKGLSDVELRSRIEGPSGDYGVQSAPSGVKITEKAMESGKSSRTYSWNYEGYRWHLTLLLDDELYGVYRERTRKRDYDLFASDPYDDPLIKSIAKTLLSLSGDYGLDESKVPGLCISFVQSLNYSSDLVSAGYDQYPRFPYETLYDSEGDCEDTSILSVAILQEMGYDVALLELPEHMALGIHCDSGTEGRSFEYGGEQYYYLETTGSDWRIGEMPEEYRDKPVRVIPVYKRPLILLDFRAQCEYSDMEGVVDVNVTMRNVGSERAENTTIYVALQAPDELGTWDTIKSTPLRVEPEETYYYSAKGLHVPGKATFRVYVRAFGEDALTEEIMSDWVSL